MKATATDAALLMRFNHSVEYLKPAIKAAHGKAPNEQVQAAIKRLGTPCVRGLQANGHSLADSIALMRQVLYS